MREAPASASPRPSGSGAAPAWLWRGLWSLPFIYWTWRFWPALAHGQLLFGSDTVALGLPQELAARRLWDQGLWPHWLPGLFGGMPGTAGLNLNFQYPSFFLAALMGLPPAQAFGVDAWAHVLLASVGAAFLARRSGLGQGAALVAGLSYGASGSLVSLAFAGHANNLRALALIPWALGLWAWAWQAQGLWRPRLGFSLAGLALALQVLAGGLQIFAYTVPVLAGFAIWLAWAQPKPGAKRQALEGGLWALLACACLSAPLLLPAWSHQAQSWHQRLSYEAFSGWSFPPKEALQWFVPGAFGWRDPTYTGEWPICLTHEYLGLLPWALGLFALWQARSQRRAAAWFFAALALLALAVGLGKHLPLHKLFYHLPVYSGFRSWARALCFLALGLSLLAGLGWQALQARLQPLPGSGRASAWLAPALLALVLVLHLADTQQLHRRFIEFREAGPYSAPAAFLRGLPAPDPQDPFRIHLDPRFEAPNAPEAAGYESEGGYHALPLNGPRAFRQAMSQRFLGYLSLMNVRYLVLREAVQEPVLRLVSQGNGAWVYENRLCLARARFVPLAIPVPAGAEHTVFDTLKEKDLDYGQVALAEGIQAHSGQPDPTAVVHWSEQSALRQRFSAKSREGGLLVLSQAWYPCWRAWVNGQPTPIRKVFGALQGLELGPGEHQIELRYIDRRFQVGMVLLVLGLLSLGFLAQRAWKESRPLSGRSPKGGG